MVRILTANIQEQIWAFVKNKDQDVMKLGVMAYSRIADDPIAAERLCVKDVDDLINSSSFASQSRTTRMWRSGVSSPPRAGAG